MKTKSFNRKGHKDFRTKVAKKEPGIINTIWITKMGEGDSSSRKAGLGMTWRLGGYKERGGGYGL